jgi:hypothetical protein
MNVLSMTSRFRELRMPDKAGLLLLVLSVVVMLAIPTPLLQTRSESIDHRVFPTQVGQGSVFSLSPENGGGRVEAVPPYGCIKLTTRDGLTSKPICNRHLSCENEGLRLLPPSSIEVFQIARPGQFYVETGSTCNSSCCDFRGMTFSGNGRRLDDGLVDRISLRLGVLGYFALAVGLLCLAWSLRVRTSLGARIAMAVGLGAAIATLWWNV